MRVRHSGDNGVTWGTGSRWRRPRRGLRVAAAAATAGDMLLVWNEGATVFRARYNGAPGPRARPGPTRSARSPASLEPTCSTGSRDRGHRGHYAGPEGVRSALRRRRQPGLEHVGDAAGGHGAAAASGVSYSRPRSLARVAFRLFFVESYGGDAAYTQLQWTTMDLFATSTKSSGANRSPSITRASLGAAAAYDGGALWLAPRGVWYSGVPADRGTRRLGGRGEPRRATTNGARVELVLDHRGLAQARGERRAWARRSAAAAAADARLQTSAGLEVPRSTSTGSSRSNC